jgi:hypothetical protein
MGRGLVFYDAGTEFVSNLDLGVKGPAANVTDAPQT